MPPSSRIQLASGRLNRAGDELTVELHRPTDSPPFTLIIRPAQPTVGSHHPGSIAAVAAAAVRILAEAQAALAQKRAEKKL